MSEEHKARIIAALNKHHAKDLKEINRLSGRGKKNNKPEKEVEKACLAWMRSLSWDVSIYEAKAVYNPDGTYRSSRMKAGVSDCMGITPEGIPIYVEFKAKDRRCTFNEESNEAQIMFLIKKINYFAFAVVVDSAELLSEFWTNYLEHKKISKDNARSYLLESLPKKRKA